MRTRWPNSSRARGQNEKARRGGPPCPPDIYIRPHDVGQARRPVPANLREKSLVRSLSLDLKSNPPYPPLTGGYEKATSRQVGGIKKEGPPERGNNKKTPLIRGGRGGCLYPLTKGIKAMSPTRNFFNSRRKAGGRPHRLSLCFYCCDCWDACAIRCFRNCTAWMTSCQTRRPRGPEL